MMSLSRAYIQSLKGNLRSLTQLVPTTILYFVIILVFSSLWKAVTEDGPIAGYDANSLFWYTIGAETAVICTRVRLIEEVGNDIANSQIEADLVRPASILWVRFVREFGANTARLLTTGLGGIVFASAVARDIPHADRLLACVCVALFAIVANVVAQLGFAALAFWTKDFRTSWFLYQKGLFLLGGMLLPLELLPDGLQIAASFTPFWTMAAAPARALSGNYNHHLFFGQIAWLTAITIFATVVWALGIRHMRGVHEHARNSN